MPKKENFKSFAELMTKRAPAKKAPAYEWQDLALRVIKELGVPGNKRGSVFQVCKKYSKVVVERAMNDTKELCKTGDKVLYFFKIVGKKPDTPDAKPAIKNSPAKAASNPDVPF